jgi:glutamyl-tRNA reductase
MLLSTCNRLEIFAEVSDRAVASDLLEQLGPAAAPHARVRFERDALLHLLRVAASLESMVVGEAQILGQLKTAAALSESLGTMGPTLSKAFARAVGAARRVRTETAIGRGAVSLSGVAVQMARKVLGALTGKSVLLVGAGEMAQLAAREIKGDGARNIWVANRSAQHAEALAAEIGGTPIGMGELPIFLERADVVVCSTSSPEPLLTRENVSRILPQRRHRPLFIIDLAVPRNVEPEVNELESVYVYDVDDLERTASQNLAQREGELQSAEAIVLEELTRHLAEMRERSAGAILPRLRSHAGAIAEAEVEKTIAALSLDEKQAKSVRAMAQAIVNKLLHHPTACLRKDSSEALSQAAAQLFGLHETTRDTTPTQPVRHAEVIQLRNLG